MDQVQKTYKIAFKNDVVLGDSKNAVTVQLYKDKSKMMAEGSLCEVRVDSSQLELVSEYIHLGLVLDESGTDRAEYCWKVVFEIGSLVDARSYRLIFKGTKCNSCSLFQLFTKIRVYLLKI